MNFIGIAFSFTTSIFLWGQIMCTDDEAESSVDYLKAWELQFGHIDIIQEWKFDSEDQPTLICKFNYTCWLVEKNPNNKWISYEIVSCTVKLLERSESEVVLFRRTEERSRRKPHLMECKCERSNARDGGETFYLVKELSGFFHLDRVSGDENTQVREYNIKYFVSTYV